MITKTSLLVGEDGRERLLAQISCMLHRNDKKKKKYTRFSLEAELVKSPPAMQQTLVQFLGQADPLEKA